MRHLRHDVPEDAARRGRSIDVQALPEARETPMRRADVEGHRSAEEIVRVESPGDQVRIGNGCVAAAASVARRTGIGSRAPWADVQSAGFVDPRDGTSSRADLDDLYDRHLDRVAGRFRGPLHVMQRLDPNPTVANGRGLG